MKRDEEEGDEQSERGFVTDEGEDVGREFGVREDSGILRTSRACRILRSSSSVNGPLQISGLRWLCHLRIQIFRAGKGVSLQIPSSMHGGKSVPLSTLLRNSAR